MEKDKVEFLGDKLLQYRKEKGLSQEELANKIGVSRQAVYKWESGKRMPDIENLVLLCRELDKNIEDLVEGADFLSQKENINNVGANNKNTRKNILKVLKILFLILLILYIINIIIKSIFFGVMFAKINKVKDSRNYSYYSTYYNKTIDDGENRKTDYTIYYKDGIQMVNTLDNDYHSTSFHYTWDISQEQNKMYFTTRVPVNIEDESQIEYYYQEGFEYSKDSPYELIIDYAKEFYSISNVLNPFKWLKIDFENKDLIFEIYNKDAKLDFVTYVKKVIYIDIESGLLSKTERYQLNELKDCYVYYDYKFGEVENVFLTEDMKKHIIENTKEY